MPAIENQLGFLTPDEWNDLFKVGHSKGAEMIREFGVTVIKVGPKLSRIPISEYHQSCRIATRA